MLTLALAVVALSAAAMVAVGGVALAAGLALTAGLVVVVRRGGNGTVDGGDGGPAGDAAAIEKVEVVVERVERAKGYREDDTQDQGQDGSGSDQSGLAADAGDGSAGGGPAGDAPGAVDYNSSRSNNAGRVDDGDGGGGGDGSADDAPGAVDAGGAVWAWGTDNAARVDLGHDGGPAGDAPGASLVEWVLLLVEDDDSLRDLSEQTLADEGFQVISAANAEEALELVADVDEVHLAVMDINMPGMNGVELAEELTDRFPQARTLYVSGHDPAELGVDVGEAPLLTKPFEPDQLAAKASECCKGYHFPKAKVDLAAAPADGGGISSGSGDDIIMGAGGFAAAADGAGGGGQATPHDANPHRPPYTRFRDDGTPYLVGADGEPWDGDTAGGPAESKETFDRSKPHVSIGKGKPTSASKKKGDRVALVGFGSFSKRLAGGGGGGRVALVVVAAVLVFGGGGLVVAGMTDDNTQTASQDGDWSEQTQAADQGGGEPGPEPSPQITVSGDSFGVVDAWDPRNRRPGDLAAGTGDADVVDEDVADDETLAAPEPADEGNVDDPGTEPDPDPADEPAAPVYAAPAIGGPQLSSCTVREGDGEGTITYDVIFTVAFDGGTYDVLPGEPFIGNNNRLEVRDEPLTWTIAAAHTTDRGDRDDTFQVTAPSELGWAEPGGDARSHTHYPPALTVHRDECRAG